MLITTSVFTFYLAWQLIQAETVVKEYYVSPDVDGSGFPVSLKACENFNTYMYNMQSVFDDLSSMLEEFLNTATDVHVFVCVLLSPTVHVIPTGTVVEIPLALNVSLYLVGEDGNKTSINCWPVGNSSGGGLVLNGLHTVEMINLTFTGCYGGNGHFPVVSVRNGTNVEVKSCRFIENEGVAIDIENINELVNISSSTFSGSKDHPSGGIRIKHTAKYTTTTIIAIEFCQFLNLNSTIVSQGDEHIGYGAGIGIFISNPSYPIVISVVSSHFEGNVAFSGAGIYARVQALSKNSQILVCNCKFIGCQAQRVDSAGNVAVREGGQGGAVGLFFRRESKGNLSIISSAFDANHAVGGAGVSVVFAEKSTEVYIRIETSNFTHNVGENGGALSVNNIMSQGDWPKPVKCRTTMFADNSITGRGEGSAIVAVYADISLEDQTEIKSNNGTAVWALGGSWLIVSGFLKFADNTGLNGGAISLHQDSAIHVHDGASLLFINNSANMGGALHVFNSAASVAELVLGGPNIRNNRCFIVPNRDDSMETRQGNVLNATIVFANNTANVTGGAIHAYSLDVCAWEEDDMELNFHTVLNSSSFCYHHNTPQDITSEIASISAYLSTTAEHAIEMGLEYMDIHCCDTCTTYCVVPGIAYRIYIKGEDTLGQEVSGTVVLCSSVHLGIVGFHDLLETNNLTHRFPTVANSGWRHIYFSGAQHQTEEIAISISTLVTPVSTETIIIHVKLMDCLVGYKYDEQYKTCLCDSGKHTHVLECRHDGGVRVEPGYWIGRIAPHRPLASYSCPDGYCRCPNGSCWFDPRMQPDQQCAEGRNGTLCGECINGYSATFGSLYPRCEANCTDKYKWELPICAGVSILVVAVAVMINLDVASGVLRSFVFYFQIVGFTLSAIPPDGILYYRWVRYLVEIPNLSIRVDACMWNGMTSIQSTALQYFIPTCIFICMALFVIVARKSARVARIPVLRPFWSLMTLTYVSIAYTTFRLLQCVPLEDGDDYYWFGDGNVRCFTETHMPYAVLAIIIAVVYVIPFPFFVAIFPSISKMNPVSDITLEAFKRKRIWWGEGWNFGQRLIIVVIHSFSNSPSLHQTLVTLAVATFFTLHAHLQPYSVPYHNLLETCLLFNLLVVNALQVYGVSNNPVPYPVTQADFLLPYAAACIWFVYFLWKKCQKRDRQVERPRDPSSVPYEPPDDSTLSRKGSEPVKLQERNTGPRDSPSLPRSYESDPLMDESRDALREPLLAQFS